MHHSRPGEMRSFTLSMFAWLILSPTGTWARAGGASSVAVTASAAASLRVVVIGRPSLNQKRTEPPASRLAAPSEGSPRLRSVLVAGVHQRGHVEPVLRDAGLLGLIEVPALLAREARARERRLGRVLELHVDHDDRRDEATVLAVVDRVGALEGLRAEAHVVDPDLPELAGAVVDVGERRSEERRVGKECRSRWSPYH